MAEMTETEIIAKLNAIDTNIATISAALTATSGAELTDHTIGNKTVAGSQKLEELLKLRDYYQKLLERIPKAITRHHDIDVKPFTGSDDSEFIGDE